MSISEACTEGQFGSKIHLRPSGIFIVAFLWLFVFEKANIEKSSGYDYGDLCQNDVQAIFNEDDASLSKVLRP